jgi:hypothetical protein
MCCSRARRTAALVLQQGDVGLVHVAGQEGHQVAQLVRRRLGDDPAAVVPEPLQRRHGEVSRAGLRLRGHAALRLDRRQGRPQRRTQAGLEEREVTGDVRQRDQQGGKLCLRHHLGELVVAPGQRWEGVREGHDALPQPVHRR